MQFPDLTMKKGGTNIWQAQSKGYYVLTINSRGYTFYRLSKSNLRSPQAESLNTPLVSTLIMAYCILDIICCVNFPLFSVSGPICVAIISLLVTFSDFLCKINICSLKCWLFSVYRPNESGLVKVYVHFNVYYPEFLTKCLIGLVADEVNVIDGYLKLLLIESYVK